MAGDAVGMRAEGDGDGLCNTRLNRVDNGKSLLVLIHGANMMKTWSFRKIAQ